MNHHEHQRHESAENGHASQVDAQRHIGRRPRRPAVTKKAIHADQRYESDADDLKQPSYF
jgi:hypothetical protein